MQDIVADIQRLKKEKNAVVLAHYYEDGDIQDVADHVGDSFYLAKVGQQSKADVILLAGVVFMAESVKILNPTKKVLVPDMAAGCSLVNGAPFEKYKAWRENHPDGIEIFQRIQRQQIDRPLFGKPLRDFFAIDRMHPVEVFGNRSRLVALDRSDEMPFQCQIRTFRTDSVHFIQRLLQIIFAKRGLPGLGRSDHRIRIEGLRYGQQVDAVNIALRAVRSVGNPLTHSLQVLAYYRHNQSSLRHYLTFAILSVPRSLVGWFALPFAAPLATPLLCRLRDYKWTFQNYSRSQSRIKLPIYICQPACRR